MTEPVWSTSHIIAAAGLETDSEILCCVQRPDLAPAPQSGYHSGGNPATAVARKATAVKSGQATSGGSQSTVSQKSATKGAASTEAPDADSHPPSKRSRLSNLSTAPTKAPGVVTSQPSSSDQPRRGSCSSGTSKAASKGVTEVGAAKPVQRTSQKAATSGSAPSQVAIVNPPAPPPGSPTASFTIQQVAPPPPPAIPLPPQLQSPSSLRSQPAASYGKQVVVPATQAPAQPAKPVPQQLPAQQLRQQAARQPLLPAGVKPMGPLPVTLAPQRSHVTHMEQQDPPQVQLPASIAAGSHAVQQHAVQPLQVVPARSQLVHGMQQQSGATQQHHHREPQQDLAGRQQPGLMSQQHGQAQSGMNQGAAEQLQAKQRQVQHDRALQGQLPPTQLMMEQQAPGQFHAGQPHPWQQQQPRFQGGPTQQMGPLQPEQGGGFQAGAQQGPQWQQGNSHPAFQAGFMPGQRGPSSGPGSGPHMQGHHHGMQQANEAQQMMQAQGLHNSMHVQAQHTQQRPVMSQMSRAVAPSSFAQAHFGAFPQQPQQYHQELQLPPPVSLSQGAIRVLTGFR